jgi:hypothetical protein
MVLAIVHLKSWRAIRVLHSRVQYTLWYLFRFYGFRAFLHPFF